tara:strand:+ start:1039 stop:2256 length:1218 start_codon:yes stop_codon:yes gene_type:complete
MKCKSCKSENHTSILDLGYHPWCNDFLKEEDFGKEKTYPLHLVYCNNCALLQLNYVVPKETMFKDHMYVSSTTKTLTRHFLELALENKKQFNLNEEDLILDIGGNDGTQLIQYKKEGMGNVLNVESADNISKLSLEAGINTINDFFNEELVIKHGLENKVKLINASGVFFHLEELHSVIRGIKKALMDDGVFVVQFMYAGTMVEKLNFDGIYHEHLCFYTLKSLSNLLSPYGLKIFDAYYSDIHSGSIVAKASADDSVPLTERGAKAFRDDKKYTKESFLEFAKEVKDKKDDLKNLLIDIKNKNPNTKIYAYGAPAKGNTLLNYFEIDNKLVDKCVEVNELKIGLYLPKSHVPIIKESTNDIPDYYLLLAHNFAEEIIERNKDLMKRGVKFIIPFPNATIISNSN